MIPGVVQLGTVAIVFQLVVIGGFYGYVRWQRPLPPAESRSRTKRLLLAGVVLVTFGQLAAFGAIGSLRTTSLFSLRQVIRIQNAGFLITFVGYGVLIVGLVVYLRSAR